MTNQELVASIKKNPISVGCIVLSCLLVGAIYFRGDAIAESETVLAQKTAESEKISLNIQYSAQLKEQTEALEGWLKLIEDRIVSASQLGTNTQYFYKLESDTKAKIVDLRQTTPSIVAKPAKGSYLPVAFAVSVQGDLNRILEFLRQVESGAHYCRIQSATCSGNTTTRGAPLTLALTLDLLGTP
jgi:hypothetical protein